MPVTLPVSLDDAKRQIRWPVADTTHDTLLTTLITAAQERCEDLLNRWLITGSHTLKLDAFPDEDRDIRLPAPVTAITSIAYLDTAGASQTLAATVYAVDAADGNKPCQRLSLKYCQVWPSTYAQKEAVTITYVAGWATAADIPEAIRQGLLVYVQGLFDGNMDLIAFAESLWFPHRWIPI